MFTGDITQNRKPKRLVNAQGQIERPAPQHFRRMSLFPTSGPTLIARSQPVSPSPTAHLPFWAKMPIAGPSIPFE